jgi:diguanylate cyclase (GGDEF)-like protein
VVLVFHDVTAERRLRSEMAYQAAHDPLTGMANRREFERRLEQVIHDSREDGGVHALLYLDLDQFKFVNDACGHGAGDEVLQQVGRLLREAIRSGDLLARVGGDEFAVILKDCPLTDAARLAQTICDRMELYRYVREDRRFRLGASIGVVPIDPRWIAVEAMIQAADSASHAAKEAGRNRVQVWTGSDNGLAVQQDERRWASRLDQALEEDRFRLFAQPIRDLGAGASGLDIEVLVRFVAEDGRLVSPGAFIPAAERFSLASRLDLWVLGRVVDLLLGRPDLGSLRGVSVNISGRSVCDRSFHAQAMALLRRAGPGIVRRLTFEITETSVVSHLADAEAFIRQVHELGARVVLDDFGAGATSFAYLRALDVDGLKIDGQFVQTLLSDPLSEATVRCFVDVARVLGIPTVAEFVDRPDLLEPLRRLGVKQAQGYLLGRPEPIEDLLSASPLPFREPEGVSGH